MSDRLSPTSRPLPPGREAGDISLQPGSIPVLLRAIRERRSVIAQELQQLERERRNLTTPD